LLKSTSTAVRVTLGCGFAPLSVAAGVSAQLDWSHNLCVPDSIFPGVKSKICGYLLGAFEHSGIRHTCSEQGANNLSNHLSIFVLFIINYTLV
jgi:hypothetical protein